MFEFVLSTWEVFFFFLDLGNTRQRHIFFFFTYMLLSVQHGAAFTSVASGILATAMQTPHRKTPGPGIEPSTTHRIALDYELKKEINSFNLSSPWIDNLLIVSFFGLNVPLHIQQHLIQRRIEMQKYLQQWCSLSSLSSTLLLSLLVLREKAGLWMAALKNSGNVRSVSPPLTGRAPTEAMTCFISLTSEGSATLSIVSPRSRHVWRLDQKETVSPLPSNSSNVLRGLQAIDHNLTEWLPSLLFGAPCEICFQSSTIVARDLKAKSYVTAILPALEWPGE